jgi:hypothetical protein
MYIHPEGDRSFDRCEVTLRTRMTIIDRHMEFAAFWPSDDEGAAAIRGSQTTFDMSSAFKPGTE